MTILQPKFLSEEFCSKGNEATDFTYPPVSSSDKTQPTLDTGFAYLQQVKPADGGAVVKRQQFNGILKWFSGILVFLNKGGLFTYNSNNTGGYQLGAVLFDALSQTFQISLKDNNTADFVVNRNYLNDNVNWKWLNPTAHEGQFMYSMREDNWIDGCGEWRKADGNIIPPQYTKSIARWGGVMPDLTGAVLAMAKANKHPPKSFMGADKVDVVLPKHTHHVTQTVHSHPDKLPHKTSGTTDNDCYNTIEPASNIMGIPAYANINIDPEGVENAQMSVIQPTFYVANIFIYCQ